MYYIHPAFSLTALKEIQKKKGFIEHQQIDTNTINQHKMNDHDLQTGPLFTTMVAAVGLKNQRTQVKSVHTLRRKTEEKEHQLNKEDN